jgi:arylsulfatase A-like enzyme
MADPFRGGPSGRTLPVGVSALRVGLASGLAAFAMLGSAPPKPSPRTTPSTTQTRVPAAPAAAVGADRYNILFVILDDVGADQLRVSNPAALGIEAMPDTPTIDAIAAQGVNFTNCWAMPECSPSRIGFFTGRYPSRTGVGTPLIPNETLPQSQCSPFEMTTPRVLEQVGYDSALFGKFHLADEANNPAGYAAPESVGFRHFNGTLFGSPQPIDTTLAGQLREADVPLYSCGFPVDAETNLPAICACAYPDGEVPCVPAVDALECLASGGVPLVDENGVPVARCEDADLDRLDWNLANGSYVWPRTINIDGAVITESSARVHMDVDDADLAIEFIQGQRERQQRDPAARWMCTVSFSGDHDPWQQPPVGTTNTPWPAQLPYACGMQVDIEEGSPLETAVERQTSDLIIENLDTQIRRVLLETGLAVEGKGGDVEITAPDTLIVVVGDNGSFLTTVKHPFNPLRAKASPYQTGVCVPLVVAGGPTVDGGRAVDHMVNIVDFFELWGEAAGIDVRDYLPDGREIDSHGMIDYLTDAAAAPVRSSNFTEYYAPSLLIEAQNDKDTCGACVVLGSICTDTFLTSEFLCNLEGGVWYGPDAEGEGGYWSCCELAEADLPELDITTILWPAQQAITDGRYKLISTTITCAGVVTGFPLEFYDLAECPFADELFGRGLDNSPYNLLKDTGDPEVDLAGHPLKLAACRRLQEELAAMNESFTPCPGDATMNGVVDMHDLDATLGFWGPSSVCDFNDDAVTDARDLGVLLANWGRCGK